MVLVFIFCIVITLLALIFLLIYFSTLTIEVKNLNLSNIENNEKIDFKESLNPKINQKIKKHEYKANSRDIKAKNIKVEMKKGEERLNNKNTKSFKLKISLKLFKNVKWIGITLNSKKINKIYTKIKEKKFDLKKLEQEFVIDDLKQLKRLKIEVLEFHLDGKVGLENVIGTSFLVSLICILISIMLGNTVQKYKKDKYQYKIVPLYLNKNVYEIKFRRYIWNKNGTYYQYNILFFKEKER